MDDLGRRNRKVGLIAGGVFVAMVGLTFASAPLYDLFCRTTGYASSTQVAKQAPDQAVDRMVTIRFTGDVARGMPWNFRPEQIEMKVKVGEEHLAFYQATNRTAREITGTATFNVQPDQAAIYFQKIACFCFTEQTLQPGQTVDMPVSFFVDPAFAEDPKMARVNTITLSYTFFEAAGRKVSQAPSPVPSQPTDRTRE